MEVSKHSTHLKIVIFSVPVWGERMKKVEIRNENCKPYSENKVSWSILSPDHLDKAEPDA